MSTSRRVLVIGLDGATFRLLKPFAESGLMPELGELMASGCHGELRSTFPPLTPPAWSSFMTGKNPGKHGVVSFRRAPVGYRTGDFINANSLRARTLWEIVGETGRTVGAINVVPSYPVRPVNGFMVACMLAPPGAKDIVYPPEYRPLLGDDYVISLEPPRSFTSRTACSTSSGSTSWEAAPTGRIRPWWPSSRRPHARSTAIWTQPSPSCAAPRAPTRSRSSSRTTGSRTHPIGSCT
jgi:hypothetical protein